MGVHGLWKLLEPAGKPVPLESLENKVLAVDVSIWLHQLVKGFQDSRGSPLPNAHLLGLFHRVCKLLFYRIKPIFVFDGGVPILKKQTIVARKQQKNRASNDADRIREQLLKTLIKSKAVRRVLGEKSSREDVSEDHPREDADMFNLPPVLEEIDDDSESETENPFKDALSHDSESDSDVDVKPSPLKLRGVKLDLHTLDVNSEEFRSLPPDVRHDILSELQETRKQNSWGRLHEMPEESGDFSSFQLGRLLKRRRVQESLEQAEKEMGGKVLSLTELQDLMCAQGVEIPSESAKVVDSVSRRIASDAATRYLLVTESSMKESHSGETSGAGTKSEHENLVESKVKLEIIEDESNVVPEFQDDWSSDEELSVNAPETIVHNFTGDNNDLSQEQILAVIQIQNQEGEVPESKSGTCSSAVSTVVPPPIPKSSLTITSEVSDEGVISDSDSDDFQEVSGTHTPHTTKNKSSVAHRSKQKVLESKIKNTMEIVISTDQMCKVEEDIFADIFSQSQPCSSTVSLETKKMSADGVASSQDTDAGGKERNPIDKGEIILEEDESTINREGSVMEKESILVEEEETVKESNADGECVVIPTKALVARTVDNCKIKMEEDIESEQEIKSGQANYHEELVPDFSQSGSHPSTDIVAEYEAVSPEAPPAKETDGQLPSAMTTLELQSLEASLEKEQHSLEAERGRQERLAASITEQMCTEAQELLQLFGLPYIVAPMEAEAQCAFLDAISLTEGTITDDSDIWLFGGRKVYKNFFNQKKHVLQYTASNIQHYFKMSRRQLVQLALLVGSDYTTGLQGVGPVTALEILAAFPGDVGSSSESVVRGLRRFRDWWMAGRPQRSARTQQLKSKLKDVKFMDGFPSQAVVDAYLKPAVDESSETFSWGKLDLAALRDYCRIKFGWTASKVDQILLPVAKRWMDRNSQRSIDSYFNVRHKLLEGENKMSKRVQKAVKLMGVEKENQNSDIDDPDSHTSEPDVNQEEKTRNKKKESSKRKVTHSKPGKRTHDLTYVEGRKDSDDKCNEEESFRALPVRAPTVPRQRDATGVKRVGAKKSTMKQDAGQCQSGVRKVKSASTPGSVKARVEKEEIHVKENEDAERTVSKKATKAPSKRKALVSKPRNENITRLEEQEPEARQCAIPEAEEGISINSSEFYDAQPGISGIKRSGTAIASADTPKRARQESNSPNSSGEAVELASLAEVDWHDDPWDLEFDSSIPEHTVCNKAKEQQPRQKLYFGGVRRNKPHRNSSVSQRHVSVPPRVEGVDDRGLRPGWRTEQRLQNRNDQWSDPMQEKGSDFIPQRVRDQQIQEQAKMKAIKVLKASDTVQSARILGGPSRGSKRARGRAKPIRKELPEHNLSESSSSED